MESKAAYKHTSRIVTHLNHGSELQLELSGWHGFDLQDTPTAKKLEYL